MEIPQVLNFEFFEIKKGEVQKFQEIESVRNFNSDAKRTQFFRSGNFEKSQEVKILWRAA
jgi:hypothetical protein